MRKGLFRSKTCKEATTPHGLGHPRQLSLRATLAEVTFTLFLSKVQPTVYIKIVNSSRGARQLGWASCLTSAGRVTLASGTTFLHVNALARLIGATLGVASATKCLDLGFIAEIRIKEVKIGSLSTRVFETRTATGSELFSLLTCPHTTIFKLVSIFSPLEMSSIKIWETIRS